MDTPPDDLAASHVENRHLRRKKRAAESLRRQLVDVERVFLAWIRTCISMLAVGYLLIGRSHVAAAGRSEAIRDTGTILVAFAALLSAFATYTYWQSRRLVEKRK